MRVMNPWSKVGFARIQLAFIIFLLSCDGGERTSNIVYYEVPASGARLLFLIIDPDAGWSVPQRGCCSYKVVFDDNGVAYINDAQFLTEWHKTITLLRTGETVPAGYNVHVLRAARSYAILFYGDVSKSQSFLNKYSDSDFMGVDAIYGFLSSEGLLINKNAEYLKHFRSQVLVSESPDFL